MVVVYRTSALSHAIARALVRLPWIALVNIVAGEPVVPELLQGALTTDALERAGADLLSTPEKAERMRAGLSRAARALGPPGASRRAAELILSAVGEKPPRSVASAVAP